MKKLILIALATVIASPALASTGPNNAVSQKITGKNAVSYADGYFGDSVTCNETKHSKFDTVGCQITNPYLQPGSTGTVGWYSDFGTGQLGTLTYTVSDDGLSYSGTAAY